MNQSLLLKLIDLLQKPGLFRGELFLGENALLSSRAGCSRRGVTVFTAATSAETKAPETVKAFIQFLAGPVALPLLKARVRTKLNG